MRFLPSDNVAAERGDTDVCTWFQMCFSTYSFESFFFLIASSVFVYALKVMKSVLILAMKKKREA